MRLDLTCGFYDQTLMGIVIHVFYGSELAELFGR
jgi:hypothetical protein